MSINLFRKKVFHCVIFFQSWDKIDILQLFKFIYFFFYYLPNHFNLSFFYKFFSTFFHLYQIVSLFILSLSLFHLFLFLRHFHPFSSYCLFNCFVWLLREKMREIKKKTFFFKLSLKDKDLNKFFSLAHVHV